MPCLHETREVNAFTIAMFLVMTPLVINVPTRDLSVPYTKRSFQIRVGTLALQLQCLYTRNIAIAKCNAVQ